MTSITAARLLAAIWICSSISASVRVVLQPHYGEFTSFCVQSELHAFVNVIVKDTWIPGNILIGLASAVYSVNTESRDKKLVAGKLGFTDHRSSSVPTYFSCDNGDNGIYDYMDTTVFDITSGLAQFPDGRLAVSDLEHMCLRVVDRRNSTEAHPLAGKCEENIDGRCTSLDGMAESSTLCNPGRLFYLKEDHRLIILDKSQNGTLVRYLDTRKNLVGTLFASLEPFYDMFYTKVSDGADMLVVTNRSLLQITISSNGTSGTCLIGNGAECKTKPLPAMNRKSFSSMAVDGDLVCFVKRDSDGNSNVYLYDKRNGRLADLCHDHQELHCPPRASAVAFIDGYLYMGDSSKYTDGYISVYRFKYNVIKDTAAVKSSNWIVVNVGENHNTDHTSYSDGTHHSTGAVVGPIIGVSVVAFVIIFACILKRVKNRNTIPSVRMA